MSESTIAAYSSGWPNRVGFGTCEATASKNSAGIQSFMGVRNPPGTTVLIRTPRPANSRARGSARASTAALVAA